MTQPANAFGASAGDTGSKPSARSIPHGQFVDSTNVELRAMTKKEAANSSRAWREALHDERIAHLIKDAYRCTAGALQRRLKKHDVLYGHWTFLRILWQTDGVTQRQLSEQAGVTEPSTFSAMKAMEAAGYITRQKMPDNRKEIRVFLTPKATALRPLIVPSAENVNRLALTGIPEADIAATRRTLLALVRNLSGDSAADTARNAPSADPAP